MVTLDATWSARTHPHDYPSSAHFSWLIDATHDGGYRLFEPDGIATAGLKELAAKGELSPFDAEIQAAIGEGSAGVLFTGRPIDRTPGRTVFEVEVDEAHPMVSLATMIAPSPGWFTGVADLQLRVNGAWIAETALPLLAWDAGADSGATYEAADVETEPRERVGPLVSAHFVADGRPVPLGTVTFRRR